MVNCRTKHDHYGVTNIGIMEMWPKLFLKGHSCSYVSTYLITTWWSNLFFDSFTRAFVGSGSDVGLGHSEYSSLFQRYSVGFRSGFCPGHSSSSTTALVNHVFTDLGLHTGMLEHIWTALFQWKHTASQCKGFVSKYQWRVFRASKILA